MEPSNAIELFGGLIGVLESLIRCRTGTISLRIYDISEIKSIRTKIFKCNPDEALDRIELALERLEEIKKLGDKIYSKLIDKPIEDGSIDPETGEPFNNIEVSRGICYEFLKSTEVDLLDLKQSLIRLNERKKNKTPEKKPASKNSHKKTLLYTEYYSHPENLDVLLDGLKKGGFVSKNTNPQHFRKIFSGGEIVTPIQWIGTKEELYYFIMHIHPPKGSSENPKIQPERRNIWNIVCQCFVDANTKDFVASTMKGQHDPTDEKAGHLRKLIKLL
jgi:hypothetical protein